MTETEFNLALIDSAILSSPEAARKRQNYMTIIDVMRKHDGRDWRRVKREVRKSIEGMKRNDKA